VEAYVMNNQPFCDFLCIIIKNFVSNSQGLSA